MFKLATVVVIKLGQIDKTILSKKSLNEVLFKINHIKELLFSATA